MQSAGSRKYNISLHNLDFRFLQRCLWRVLQSGIQRHIVRWKSTDVCEEHTVSTSKDEKYEIKQETSVKLEADRALRNRSACRERNITWPRTKCEYVHFDTRRTHFCVVPRSRMLGSRHPLLHTSSWRNASLVEHRDNFTCLLVVLLPVAVDALHFIMPAN
jgi:hypothetical protein